MEKVLKLAQDASGNTKTKARVAFRRWHQLQMTFAAGESVSLGEDPWMLPNALVVLAVSRSPALFTARTETCGKSRNGRPCMQASRKSCPASARPYVTSRMNGWQACSECHWIGAAFSGVESERWRWHEDASGAPGAEPRPGADGWRPRLD